MIVSVIANFLRWKETAKVAERVAAAGALSRAYVQRALTLEQAMAAEAALTLLLEDPSPKVRLAMSEALCMSSRAPLEVIAALASDQREIASPIILHSPLLTETDLIDLAASTGIADIQVMVASRMHVSAKVIAVLAEVGCAKACAALVANTSVHIAPENMRRIAERHGNDGPLRTALLASRSLPADCRHMLLRQVSETLGSSSFVTGVLGIAAAAKVADAARMKASLSLAADDAHEGEQAALVERMCAAGELTSSFLTRTVAYRRTGFFASALARLTNVRHARVKELLERGSERALVSLFRRAGLHEVTHPPLLSAIKLIRDIDAGRRTAGPQELAWTMMQALEGSSTGCEQERTALTSLLRRIFLEELRHNARSQAWSLAAA